MTNEELALECVRLAVPLASPSTQYRVEVIVQISKQLYAHIKSLSEGIPVESADKPDKPEKPRNWQRKNYQTPLDEDKSRNVAA